MTNIFKERLKELRLEKEMGHRELGKIIGVSNGTISTWENGINEPKLSYLIKLAVFFDVSLDYLTGRED
ncbi:MAG: helix-turn-helix transcriptional regulator [Firmicutes bacterium]|nr:helix-turn-helix transcriptional regulator [Bacillota bacterium]